MVKKYSWHHINWVIKVKWEILTLCTLHVCSVSVWMIHLREHTISVAFLPKLHTLNLIMRKDCTNKNYKAFCQIINQYYSKASQSWKTGKTMELSQIGKDKEDLKVNAIWYLDLDPEIEKYISSKLMKCK